MKKILLGILIGGIVFGTIGAGAAYVYTARDIGFIPNDDSWEVGNAREALDSLKTDITNMQNLATQGDMVYSTGTAIVGLVSDNSPYVDSNGNYILASSSLGQSMIDNVTYKLIEAPSEIKGNVGAETVTPFVGNTFKNVADLLDSNYSQSDFYCRAYSRVNGGSEKEVYKVGSCSINKNGSNISFTAASGSGPSKVWYHTNYYIYTPPVSLDFNAIHYKVDSAQSSETSGYVNRDILLENIVTGETYSLGSIASATEKTVTIPQSFKDNLTNNMVRIVIRWGAYDSTQSVVFSILRYE